MFHASDLHSTTFLTKATHKYSAHALQSAVYCFESHTCSQLAIYQSCVKTLVDASFSGSDPSPLLCLPPPLLVPAPLCCISLFAVTASFSHLFSPQLQRHCLSVRPDWKRQDVRPSPVPPSHPSLYIFRYSMGSGSWTSINPNELGMIPRAFSDMFGHTDAARAAGIEVSIRVSFIEIHNEELRDLLDSGYKSNHLAIREDAEGGIFVAGAEEREVTCLDEILGHLERGTAATPNTRTVYPYSFDVAIRHGLSQHRFNAHERAQQPQPRDLHSASRAAQGTLGLFQRPHCTPSRQTHHRRNTSSLLLCPSNRSSPGFCFHRRRRRQ